MTKHTIEYDECRSLESTLEQLESVVDGLRSRALTIAHGDRRLLFLLAPDSPLELTIHAERSGNRERLQISLEWRRQNLHISEISDGALPQGQDQEREEDQDDEDWDDQAETIRQGSNLLAQELQRNSVEH